MLADGDGMLALANRRMDRESVVPEARCPVEPFCASNGSGCGDTARVHPDIRGRRGDHPRAPKRSGPETISQGTRSRIVP